MKLASIVSLVLLMFLASCGEKNPLKETCRYRQVKWPPNADFADLHSGTPFSKESLFTLGYERGELLYFHLLQGSELAVVDTLKASKDRPTDVEMQFAVIVDSLEQTGHLFLIEKQDHSSSGIEPTSDWATFYYLEIEDANWNPNLTEALVPIDSETEAWIVAKAHLSDQTLTWFQEDLGQRIQKESDGYRLWVTNFHNYCDNQKVGLLEVTVASDGTTELVEDQGAQWRDICKCWELPE